MKKKTNKHGFTIVELVIVIAIVAILAAVLIPTFINLTRSADETTALADARNYAQQLLPELVDCVNEAGDLIMIQYKNDAFYVHAYLVADGRMLSYKENPISEKTIADKLSDPEYADIDDYANELLDYLVEQNVIFKAMTDTNTEGEWWDSSEMAELCNSLGFDTKNTRVRADYSVIAEAFEQPAVSLEGNGGESGNTHTCNADTLTYHAGQTKTCVKNGWDAYYVCSCGQMYKSNDVSEANKINGVQMSDDQKAMGHKDNNSGVEYISLSGSRHAHKCSACGSAFQTEDCKYDQFFKENGKYYESCICGPGREISSETEGYNVFKFAMDLNEIIGNNTKPTMYDTFCVIRDNTSSYSKISDITDAINTTENDTKLKIVWDQTNGYFSIVKERLTKNSHGTPQTNVEVLYTMKDKGGLTGIYNGSVSDAIAFWHVYDKTHPIPSLDEPAAVHVYSIYWGATTTPNHTKQNVKDPKYIFQAGFDCGEWVPTGTITITLSIPTVGSGKHNAIVRTQSQNITVQMGTHYTLDQYGTVGTMSYSSETYWGDATWNIYGDVQKVEIYSTGASNLKLTVNIIEGGKVIEAGSDSRITFRGNSEP